ncbi:MAG: GNAT family N-acetyltransferase [Cyanobacteria bacterium P01_F01_bin.33]
MSIRLKFRWCHDITQVSAAAWSALVEPETAFCFEWEWLYCLEASGSAIANEGWLPCHLLVEQNGELVAAAPMYLKAHSYGEYVFDQEWARVSHQLGERYYPKLLGMSPFTPATDSYRFLFHPDVSAADLLPAMMAEIDRFCQREQISVCSFLYVEPEWHQTLEKYGFVPRITHNYQWQNQSYQSYDDFLKQFNANQRRNLKRERKAVAQTGIEVKYYRGDEIPTHFFSLMYRLYSNTCDQFWGGSKYLNRRFFELVEQYCRDRVLFVAGEFENKPVGMSFCLTKGDRLFGRYWGALEDIKFLHFCLCYYNPIEWAIERGIRNFDPGAGGQHKIRRGFPATPNYSYHRFYRSRLEKVLVPYLEQVNPLVLEELERMNLAAVPFRSDLLPELTALTRQD